ncbi:MAG: cytochrome c oxidase subunit II [Rhodospirillales bacterium]|nr:cytochrome c oxidase subunit II [Rhodospirillales bacterium]
MWVAIIVVLVVVGSVVFHLVTPWWSTPIASNWGSIDLTIDITFWITGTVFILVGLFTAMCIFRFRNRPGQSSGQSGHKAEYEPENKKLEVWLSILTAVGVAGLLAPGLIVWNDFVTVPEEAVKVEVMGQQWQWGFRYPGADGLLGTSDARNVNADNPFGLSLDDPNGKDDILVESDDLHLVLDQPVNVLMRSLDVLHDFYVPQFRAKMDMVPGLVTFVWLIPTRTGTFDILCAELCGSGHYAMRGKVVVQEEAAFKAWLAQQPTFAQMRAQAENKSENNSSSLALNAVGAEPGHSVVAR